MAKFVVEGGYPLVGKVRPSGSKNASLPVIFASLTTVGVTAVTGLADIADVRDALDIVSSFGAMVTRLGDVTYIDTRSVRYREPERGAVSRLRASTYLIGACLSRFGRVKLGEYGGCNFGKRPIDLHIFASERLGAVVCGDELSTSGLSGARIDFKIASVGATVNALIMAASAEGETVISGGASEEHIDTLIEYLRSAGALIEREGGDLHIIGAPLGGGSVTIPPDPIEAGTFLTLSAITGGGIGVEGVPWASLEPFLTPILEAGGTIARRDGAIYLESPPTRRVDIVTAPHPGYPTDLAPIISPLLALGAGGRIKDAVWPDRFGYLSMLSDFGVRSTVGTGEAEIYPSHIVGASSRAPDLRGGAALLIAALSARGRSEILSAETVLRGYEGPTGKLRRLGARILLS